MIWGFGLSVENCCFGLIIIVGLVGLVGLVCLLGLGITGLSITSTLGLGLFDIGSGFGRIGASGSCFGLGLGVGVPTLAFTGSGLEPNLVPLDLTIKITTSFF
jgi:hypothetical protein